jgi:cyclophilin family peptidyl-prolyl cis-trans isomerase
VSQQRPSRRAAPVEVEEHDLPPPWGRHVWVALLVMGVIIVAALGSGLLISKALERPVPPQLASCATSTQIAPHRFIGPQPMCITDKEKLQATISTSQGDIVLLLHPEVAPVTVNNFVVLATHGYYNGLIFWKAEDWVVQTGDPGGDGRGGPGYNLPDEPGTTPWGLGAVGMARVPGGPINGSQFFIMKAPWPAGGPTAVYNRFASVISGLDHVQAISVTDTINSVTIKVS